ncbi:MAG: DUF4180 domain-containing protein [Bacteroidota bacterium]
MKIHITGDDENKIAEIESEEILLKSVQDALDLMAECRYNHSCEKMILHGKNIIPDFFDLKTKIAGDILQKFSIYQFGLAIVGDFKKYESKSLHDFIYESNKQGQVIFVSTPNEAKEKLI